MGGAGVSEYFFTMNLNLKFAEGWVGGVERRARVSDFLNKESKSEKKKFFFFLGGGRRGGGEG